MASKKTDNTKNKSKNKKKNKPTPRYRNWGLIVYPESAPKDWVDIINAEGVPWAYILHDKDTKVDENGEIVLKKAHYQVIMKYSTSKTYRQMQRLTGRLRAPNPMILNSLIASGRDLLHLDQKSPHQYKYHISEVHVFNGLDFPDLVKPNKTEMSDIMRDIRRIIQEEGFTEVFDLYVHLDEINHAYSKVLDKKLYPIDRFITSGRYKLRDKPKSKPKAVTPLGSEMKTHIGHSHQAFLESRAFQELKALTIKEAQESGFFDLDQEAC